ncbi:uncharacterized protein PHACADRAFT_260978 [Phanerochaete carnosa HHB-10118-sp]|uniref:Uncharacterized protein n=1 Tax=Phanerochaete carnosa (strain HHB-10118-sp) TaxID=650164 RepID=K5W095_PHACS|nr:uncharacterized protein PHACADRAFT_260978 [Phanerochaete carnosa HHB-10118-sp]EKM52515.1 hypothetical protein PHACADRAFT_260978 [Phanerochaete carnosa HHB-10118-sp]
MSNTPFYTTNNWHLGSLKQGDVLQLVLIATASWLRRTVFIFWLFGSRSVSL